MVDIAHRVGIKAPASQVYQALATPEGVAAWWAEDTHGEREVGGTVKARFTNNGQEIGAMEMKLEQLIPGELVLWKFLAGPAEWIGTHVPPPPAQTDEQNALPLPRALRAETGRRLLHRAVHP